MAPDGSTRTARLRKPTLDDVAALAGVSRMVASRAVNNGPNVSPRASAKVKEAATRLGYVRHQGAASLATNRTGVVAFLAPMTNDRFFSDPNVAQVVRGAKEALSVTDVQLVTLIAENAHDEDVARHYVGARHVDGLVVLSPELVEDLVRDLCATGTALAATATVPGAIDLDSITYDVRGAARSVAEVLPDVRRCVVLAGGSDREGTGEMLLGLQDVLGPLDPGLVVYTDHSFQAGHRAVSQLVESGALFDAVVCSSDVMAVATVEVLQRVGRRVPDDVRVTGWDNSLPADACDPSLTTVSIPFHTIGRDLATMVLEQINGEQGGRHRTVPVEIVRRASA